MNNSLIELHQPAFWQTAVMRMCLLV